MKKVLMMLLGVIFVASSASAMPIALDPTAVGAGTGATGVFDQLDIYVQTTSTNVANNGLFADVGDLAVKALLASGPVDGAGLDSSWYLVGGWDNLSGYATGSGEYTYTSGTMNLYVTEDPYAFNTWQLGADDDTGFATGTQVASLSLVGGTGFLTAAGGKFYGAIDLTWQFESIADGFWLDAQGQALSLDDLQTGEYLIAIADANTDKVAYGYGPNQEVIIYSDHNGSVEVGVVPEPATMALFGTGLLGLAGAGLRKKKRS